MKIHVQMSWVWQSTTSIGTFYCQSWQKVLLPNGVADVNGVNQSHNQWKQIEKYLHD